MVKTRLCLQYERLAQIAERSVASSKIGDTGRLYRTIPRSETTWSTLVNLWRFEGLRGLYRGFLPGLFGVSHGAIQFMLYEEMRNAYNQRYRDRPVNAKLVSLWFIPFPGYPYSLCQIDLCKPMLIHE